MRRYKNKPYYFINILNLLESYARKMDFNIIRFNK